MNPAPHSELVPALFALILITAASVVGSVSFALGNRLNAVVPYLVSAAAGVLLGTASCNLLPEALERSGSSKVVGALFASGILLSFLSERFLGILFPHEHHAKDQHHSKTGGKSLVANVLLSGAVHSFVDGVGIAVAFTFSHAAGVATALAVLLHEVPHHIVNVGVLIYGGLTRKRAILLNLLSTAGCGTGGVAVLLLGPAANVITPVLLPLTAANFFYIAVGILMPELQHEKNRVRLVMQLGVLTVSVFLVASISYLFPEQK